MLTRAGFEHRSTKINTKFLQNPAPFNIYRFLATWINEEYKQFRTKNVLARLHYYFAKKSFFVIVVSQNGRRAGMELQRFQRRVGVAGLRGTKWENCLHFFMNFPGEHTQPILFSPKTDPKKLLAYEKKVLDLLIDSI